MELNQTRNQMICDRMEQQHREPVEETLRLEELHRVFEKIYNLPQNQHDKQPGASGNAQEIN